MKIKSKKDAVIIDKCLDGLTGLNSIGLFSNSVILKLRDINLSENAKDSEILEKAILLKNTGDYEQVSILTTDKGRDGDKTFRKFYKGISIIYLKQSNYEKIKETLRKSNIKNLKSISGLNVRIYGDKIEKTGFAKYDKSQKTHIKYLKPKNFTTKKKITKNVLNQLL